MMMMNQQRMHFRIPSFLVSPAGPVTGKAELLQWTKFTRTSVVSHVMLLKQAIKPDQPAGCPAHDTQHVLLHLVYRFDGEVPDLNYLAR